MDILNYVSLPALSGKREATVKSYRKVDNANGGYVEVVFKLSDRDYILNIFPGQGAAKGKQIKYITDALRDQLGLKEGAMTTKEILDIAKTNPINLYFSWSNEYGRLNVAFHQSAPIEETDLAGVEA